MRALCSFRFSDFGRCASEWETLNTLRDSAERSPFEDLVRSARDGFHSPPRYHGNQPVFKKGRLHRGD